MQPTSPSAFLLSATLHGVCIALVLFFTYGLTQGVKESPKIFELVAGEGDNYMAEEAPALGTPDGVGVAMPDIPAPKVFTPPEPAPLQAAPAPAPAAPEPVIERVPTTKPAPENVIRDFSKDVKRISTKRQQRLEAAEKKKRDAAERKAKEEALKNQRMTKAEFDKQNKSKGAAAPKGGSPPKIAKIDAKGIAGGIYGGSTANTKGGAGGTALRRDGDADPMDLYFSLLKQKLKDALDKPPGLSDTLVAVVQVELLANGTLTGARIKSSSGSSEFDEAALAAIVRVRSIGPRPDRKSETINIPFRMREMDEE